MTGGQGVATVRFSRRPDVEPIWQDVQDGILRNVSVGAKIHAYEQTEATATSPMQRLATDWEPFEVSAVPVGADPNAQIRAAETPGPTNPCLVVHASAKELTMPDEKTPPPAPAPTFTLEDEPTPELETEANLRDIGADQERERIDGILNGCLAARLPISTARKLISDKVPLVKAQAIILETLARDPIQERGPRSGPTPVRMINGDPLENVWKGVGGALLHRIDPQAFPLDDNARQYRSRSVLRCAEECLEQRGIRTRDFSKNEIAGMALGLVVRAGFHTTSDFPNILADVANKTLRRGYEVAPQTWATFARRISMPDFKSVKRNQLGEAPALLKVLEHGEFTRGTVAEGKEEFALATWGRIFGITRQAIVNDDLDAFGRMTMSFGRSAKNLESDVVYYQLLKNANMGDGIALFATAHNNLAGTPAAIGIDPLGLGFGAMQKQTGLDGVTYLNVSPRYLLVPPSKITLAMQYTTVINPSVAQASNVNPWAGLLSPISEPRLEGGVTVDGDTVAGSATAWYLVASPDQIDLVEYGYLDGEDGPVVETRVGFDSDAFEIKCRHDFAAKAIDFRGFFKNTGV